MGSPVALSWVGMVGMVNWQYVVKGDQAHNCVGNEVGMGNFYLLKIIAGLCTRVGWGTLGMYVQYV